MAKARIVYVVDDKELKELQKELNQIKKKNKEVADGFGDSEKEIKKTKGSLVDLKGIIGGIGLAALATGALVEFAKLTKEINKNRKETALLTKETGIALDNITAKIRATSKVFDKEYNEVLRSANAVSKQLGITMTESMDEINNAMSRGLDINGEYLETIREYSPFMKQAGIDFRQFNVLIQKQVTEGVFSDKGIDAIKEAVISIQEMTPATVDALKAIGLSSDEISKDIQSGATTYFEVIQEIGVKTREALNPRIKGQILADIFRGAGEDAGDYALTIDSVGTEFSELTEEQQKYVDGQAALLTATIATEKALISLTASTQGLGIATATLWENIKSATLRGVEATINLFQSAETQVDSFRKSLGGAGKDTLTAVMDDLIKSHGELNEELKETERRNDKLATLEVTARFDILNEKIQIVNKSITDLNVAEKAEAEAALIAAEAAEKLAKAKANQAFADREAAKAAKQAAIDAKERTKIAAKSLAELKSDLAKEQFEEEKEIKEIFAKTLEEQEIEDAKELADELRNINKTRLEGEAEDEKEAADLKEQFIFDSLNNFAQITSSFVQLRIDQINQELTALEFARNRELDLAEGNKVKEAQINAKFDAQRKELQRKQLNANKAQAVFEIAINTAQAIVKGIAMFGPPPSPLGIAAIASAIVIGGIQSGLVLSQKVPEFAEGVLRFKGQGSRTSDSNLVKLSNEETVLSAQTTDDYYPAIKAIYNREISPDILNNLVMNGGGSKIVINDYDKLADAILNKPEKNVIVDSNGFTGHIISRGQYLRLKQAKFKM